MKNYKSLHHYRFQITTQFTTSICCLAIWALGTLLIGCKSQDEENTLCPAHKSLVNGKCVESQNQETPLGHQNAKGKNAPSNTPPPLPVPESLKNEPHKKTSTFALSYSQGVFTFTHKPPKPLPRGKKLFLKVVNGNRAKHDGTLMDGESTKYSNWQPDHYPIVLDTSKQHSFSIKSRPLAYFQFQSHKVVGMTLYSAVFINSSDASSPTHKARVALEFLYGSNIQTAKPLVAAQIKGAGLEYFMSKYTMPKHFTDGVLTSTLAENIFDTLSPTDKGSKEVLEEQVRALVEKINANIDKDT